MDLGRHWRGNNAEAAERRERILAELRYGPIFLIMIVAASWLLFAMNRIGRTAFTIAVLASPVVAAAMSLAMKNLLDGVASLFVSLVHAGGNIAPTKQYSEQDALVMQGRIADAISSYQELVAVDPSDLDARLLLAALLAKEGNDLEAAERVYLEVRELAPKPHHTATLSNGLIDLYRKLGRHDDLKRELGRFARRFPESREGKAAAEYLARLEGDDSAHTPFSSADGP
ncbi:MAG: tetratricopeptide repeat protein [Gemmatimonadales bacterium]